METTEYILQCNMEKWSTVGIYTEFITAKRVCEEKHKYSRYSFRILKAVLCEELIVVFKLESSIAETVDWIKEGF